MKDPQQNKSGNGRGEPPDLDELWREFNRRLQRLLGRLELKQSNSIGPKRKAYYLVGVLLAALGVWVGSGFYMVQSGQASVVLQLGEYKKTTHAGWHWRLPYPLQSHEMVDLSTVRSVEIGRNNLIRAADVKDSSMLTQEGKILNVRFNVRYAVNNARAFLFNSTDPEMGVMQAAEAAVREVVGQRKMADLLVNGKEQLGSAIVSILQNNLDISNSGIHIREVVMQSVQPPEQTQAVSDEVRKIISTNESQKNAAQTYANEIIPAAKATAVRMLDEAESYKASVIAQAHGEVARFKPLLAAFIKSPEATREHMYLDTMRQVYGNSMKIFVDGNKAASTQILLPSDRLKDKSLPSTAQNASSGDASQTKLNEAAKGESAKDEAAQPSDDSVPDMTAPTSSASPTESSQSVNKEAIRARDFLRDRDREHSEKLVKKEPV